MRRPSPRPSGLRLPPGLPHLHRKQSDEAPRVIIVCVFLACRECPWSGDDPCVPGRQRCMVRTTRSAQCTRDRRPRGDARTGEGPSPAGEVARRIACGRRRGPVSNWSEPFVLTPADSGVVYEAAPGARPVFSGGQDHHADSACRRRPVAGEDRRRGQWFMVLRSVVRRTAAGQRGPGARTSSITTCSTCRKRRLSKAPAPGPSEPGRP